MKNLKTYIEERDEEREEWYDDENEYGDEKEPESMYHENPCRDALERLKVVLTSEPYFFTWIHDITSKRPEKGTVVAERKDAKVNIHFRAIIISYSSGLPNINMDYPSSQWKFYFTDRNDSGIMEILNKQKPVFTLNAYSPLSPALITAAYHGEDEMIRFHSLEPVSYDPNTSMMRAYKSLNFYESLTGSRVDKVFAFLDHEKEYLRKKEYWTKASDVYLSELKIQFSKPEDIDIRDWVNLL